MIKTVSVHVLGIKKIIQCETCANNYIIFFQSVPACIKQPSLNLYESMSMYTVYYMLYENELFGNWNGNFLSNLQVLNVRVYS